METKSLAESGAKSPAAVIGILCASILGGCMINEIRMPENPCLAPLREKGWGHPVSFANPVEGQLSVYRRFYLKQDTLSFQRDTLLAMVGAFYPESFTFVEQECPENYLAPDPAPPYSHLLQWVGDNLRPSGYTTLLPFDAYEGFALHPNGPTLEFRGLRPPDDLKGPLYGRILGFTLGSRVLDTVYVRVDGEWPVHFWIYSAEEGPLAAAEIEPGGNISGWLREPSE